MNAATPQRILVSGFCLGFSLVAIVFLIEFVCRNWGTVPNARAWASGNLEASSTSSERPVRVSGPDRLPVTAVGADQLARVLQRIEVPVDADLAILSHLVRCLDAHEQSGHEPPAQPCEPNAQQGPLIIDNPQERSLALVERLLPRAGSKIDHSEYFEFTEFGCRYRVSGRRSMVAEQHPGQVLSALAEIGVPLTRTAISSGRRFRVADLVDECAESFGFDEEIEWRSVALALYRPQVREWNGRDGELVSFDVITKELLRRTRIRGADQYSCWGTHSLYALAVFLSVDAKIPLWTDRLLRTKVESSFFEAGERLTQSQRADGSWDEHWELPLLSHGGSTMNDWQRLLITGHHLEWLALAPKELRPSDQVLLAAGDFVLKRVCELHAEQLLEQICPCSHGLRAFGVSGIRIVNNP